MTRRTQLLLGLEMPVAEGDEMTVVIAISGGPASGQAFSVE
jgi:hypothetical protein